LTKSTKLINELFDNYVNNYLTSYGSPYLTVVYKRRGVFCYAETLILGSSALKFLSR